MKELSRIRASYDDKGYWVEYLNHYNRVGYEFVSDYNDKIHPKEYKIDIDDLSSSDYIEDIIYSDNDMLFISAEDYDNYDDILERILIDLDNYSCLSKYIDISDKEIIIYGGVITEISFKTSM